MSVGNTPPSFSLLPDARPPWKQFLLSMSTEGIVLFLLGWVAIIQPIVYKAPEREIVAIPLVETPPPVPHDPQPIRKLTPPTPTQMKELAQEAIKVPPPVLPKPKVVEEEVAAPKIQMAVNKPVIEPAPTVMPKQLVKTNVFSTGSSAAPTLAAAPQKVQTGGFGDPNGVPAQQTYNNRPANIAKLGSFDLPAGGGTGNGTGGEKGVKGVVASAGFGNGTAIGDGSGRVSASRVGTVSQGAFGDAAAAVVRTAKISTPEAVARTTPVEVISKPTPVYTEEGRKLKIEGEVLLEVTFEASGRVHVLRVVRSLGHGLDEAAIRAAEQIRFKPALKDGQPSDSNAVLHIVFQLA